MKTSAQKDVSAFWLRSQAEINMTFAPVIPFAAFATFA